MISPDFFSERSYYGMSHLGDLRFRQAEGLYDVTFSFQEENVHTAIIASVVYYKGEPKTCRKETASFVQQAAADIALAHPEHSFYSCTQETNLREEELTRTKKVYVAAGTVLLPLLLSPTLFYLPAAVLLLPLSILMAFWLIVRCRRLDTLLSMFKDETPELPGKTEAERIHEQLKIHHRDLSFYLDAFVEGITLSLFPVQEVIFKAKNVRKFQCQCPNGSMILDIFSFGGTAEGYLTFRSKPVLEFVYNGKTHQFLKLETMTAESFREEAIFGLLEELASRYAAIRIGRHQQAEQLARSLKSGNAEDRRIRELMESIKRSGEDYERVCASVMNELTALAQKKEERSSSY